MKTEFKETRVSKFNSLIEKHYKENLTGIHYSTTTHLINYSELLFIAEREEMDKLWILIMEGSRIAMLAIQ